MIQYKAAIFDLDGTVADTVVSIATASNLTLEHVGLEPRPVEEYKFYAGDGADTLIQRALLAAGDVEGALYGEAYAYYQTIFEEYCTYKVKAFDGMKETLDTMKNEGLRLAVFTNKPHARAIRVLEEVFGEGYFDVILGQRPGYPKKPDPTGLYDIMEVLAVEAKECIYVGDTNVDMQTGNQAGIFTVGVLWGFRDRQELEENHAHALVEHPEELLGLILKRDEEGKRSS